MSISFAKTTRRAAEHILTGGVESNGPHLATGKQVSRFL